VKSELRPQNLKIPKILHQTWTNARLPVQFAKWRASWIAHHPSWDHRFYDDEAVRRIIFERAPQWRKTYDDLPRMIQRIDFFRYLIIYLDGGMYADIDTIPYMPCDNLLDDASCVFAVELHLSRKRQTELSYSNPWQIANFIFAASPGHPFLADVLERIRCSATMLAPDDDAVQDTTGPCMLTRLVHGALLNAGSQLKILPQVNWNAPWFYPRTGPLKARIYVRHTCQGSWRQQRLLWQRLRRGVGYRLPNPLATAGPTAAS
jgi:mannosyltransferase OCH1-like enzyme